MPKRRRQPENQGLERTAACDAISTDSDEIAALERLWRRCLVSVVEDPAAFPPLVLCELRLRRELLGLRDFYATLLRGMLGKSVLPPRESFNRWLLERENRKTIGSTTASGSHVAPGLYQEILEDLPAKVPHVFPTDTAGQEARRRGYAQAVSAWAAYRCPGDHVLRDACAVAAEEPQGGHMQSDAERFAILRATVAPAVLRVDGPVVESLILKLEAAADEAFAAVRSLRRDVVTSGMPDASVEVAADANGHTVLTSRDGDVSDCSLTIGAPCLERLTTLFQLARARLQSSGGDGDRGWEEAALQAGQLLSNDLPGRGGFWRLVFYVLCRCDAFCGPGKAEGQGLQAAVPPAVLRAIASHLSVLPLVSAPVECCASPLNCRATGAYARGLFGSLCPDIDVWFGSLGSFLGDNFSPTAGLFEVNPPFDLTVMGRCSDKLLRLLEAAEVIGESLAFAVFLPEWQTPWTLFGKEQPTGEAPNTPLLTLLHSRFACGSLVVRQQQHSYVHGLNHERGECEGERLMRAISKSRCIVLQTSAHRSRRGSPSEVFWQELRCGWRGQVKNRAHVAKSSSAIGGFSRHRAMWQVGHVVEGCVGFERSTSVLVTQLAGSQRSHTVAGQKCAAPFQG